MGQRPSKPTAPGLRPLPTDARRIVIKVGSALLARAGQRLFGHLAAQIARAHGDGRQVVLVSSGAIALGLAKLALTKRPQRVDQLQAAAAVGQLELMRRWSAALGRRQLTVAQVLLTHADLAERERFINARHALAQLLRAGIIPIANENDTVATDEIRVGDNDSLSAQVASLVDADLLVLLTTTDGLYDADPERHPHAQRLSVVAQPDRILHLAGGAGSSGLGTGGMYTKVLAAKTAASYAVPVVIAAGDRPKVLDRVLAGEDVGTLFLCNESSLKSRKHWIGFTLKPQGTLEIDAGAATALVERNRSLLPSGLCAVRGRFARGAMVEICGPDGVVARGLVAYDSDELARLVHKKTSEIEATLGYIETPEIVHRDDLVVLVQATTPA